MSVVCEGVFAPRGAELSLLARQCSFANDALIFHTASKVGLQAYHTHVDVLLGVFQVRL
jgi:hypothetical protein